MSLELQTNMCAKITSFFFFLRECHLSNITAIPQIYSIHVAILSAVGHRITIVFPPSAKHGDVADYLLKSNLDLAI